MYGLNKWEVERIVQSHLDKNPDLKYYINDPYIEEFMLLLIDGICDAISKNNERIIDDVKRDIRINGKYGW